MKREKFEIAVIGSGPGGYVAAIKAAQQGKSVVLIERGELGGTCLNVGCIPTKTLLAHAHVMKIISQAASFGIQVGDVSFDYSKMKQRKDEVVLKIRKNLSGLLQANQITVLKGQAEFTSATELKIEGEASALINASKIIIASGSAPLDIAAFPCDHQKIFNSTSILQMEKLPKSIAIIGGGYIGCEFASLFAQLGVKVTILEALDSIVALQGKAISEALTSSFKKKGIEILTGVMVEGIQQTSSGVNVQLKDKGAVAADIALVSIGRKIVSKELKVENAGLLLNEKGVISVNEKMETDVPGIYAIGDVTGKAMLAHVASHQGIIAGINACGGSSVMHYEAVPAVIFTDPEIATVGLTLEQALEAGFSATVGKYPFQALGKSVAANDTEGFAQVVVDRRTERLLGAQVVGAEASSLIAEMTVAIANELTLKCLTETIHAHPTLPEAWLEAALIAGETPIHFPPKLRKS